MVNACPVTLWPYQRTAFDSVMREFTRENVRSTLLVMPTGCGKTVVFGFVSKWMAEDLGGRVLILAHRGELLEQASRKLSVVGLESAIEKGEQDALESVAGAASGMWPRDVRVVVGSVQSFHERRLRKWPRDYFNLVVVDEAHHACADSYKRILNHFAPARVLGVTATADRLDGTNLGTVFQSLAFEYSLSEAIRGGWLCNLVQVKSDVEIDLRGIRTVGGDFNQGDLEERISREIEPLVNGAREVIGDRPTIVFTPDVKSAEAFAEGLRRVDVSARSVHGKSWDRAAILRAFEDRDFQVLTNCALLTEGYDAPWVSAIVLARPTQSRALLSQMAGRGTRRYPDKEDCLLVDYQWQLDRHRLARPVDLVAPALVTDSSRALAHHLVESGRQTDLLKAFDEAEAILKRKAEERKRADRAEAERIEREKQERERLRLSVRRRDSGFTWIERNPLGISASEITRRRRVEDLPEHHPRAMESQVRLLTQYQVDPAEARRLSPQEAVDMLNQLIGRKRDGLASLNQIRCLLRAGFARDACWAMTVPEASYHIDNLKKGRQHAG